MSLNTHAYAFGYTLQQARTSSLCIIGLQSTRSATARAQPTGSILGDREDTIRSGPRYFVDQVRVSIVFFPAAIMFAHGCLTDSAFTVKAFLCYSPAR